MGRLLQGGGEVLDERGRQCEEPVASHRSECIKWLLESGVEAVVTPSFHLRGFRVEASELRHPAQRLETLAQLFGAAP